VISARSEASVAIEVEHAIPILPSRDLQETLEFYARLGFENRGGLPPEESNYLIIGRGGVELHFVGAPETNPFTTGASCYIRTVDADALYDEWREAIVDDPATGSRVVSPRETEHGMREFALVDPSGNLIRVGSPSLV
jgi:catechol 2,3-dioxygenase-like lactoylglutathione lyase family enzyme